MSIPKKN